MGIEATPASRRRPDPFFLAILGGLALLLAAAAITIAITRRPAPTLPADSPEGTIQHFLTILERRDYQGAYALLSDQMPRKPLLEEFTRANADRQRYEQPQRIQIVGTDTNGDSATVRVSITHYSTNALPFGGNDYTTEEVFTLRREASVWRITSLPVGYGYEYR